MPFSSSLQYVMYDIRVQSEAMQSEAITAWQKIVVVDRIIVFASAACVYIVSLVYVGFVQDLY